MGCLSAYISRVSAACAVIVGKGAGVSVSVTCPSSLDVEVSSTRSMGVDVSATYGVEVDAQIVCTSSQADGSELWWCKGWRVLWDDGIKALWFNTEE